MKKRILAVLLAVCLLCGVLPSASAVNPLEWVETTLWGVVHDSWENTGSTLRQWWDNTGGAFWDGFAGSEGDAEGQFVGHVQDTLGTIKVGANGYLIPMTGVATSSYGYSHATYPAYSSIVDTLTWVRITDNVNTLRGFAFPSSGYVSIVADVASTAGGSVSQYFRVSIGGGELRLPDNDVSISGNSAHSQSNRIAVAMGAKISSDTTTSVGAFGGISGEFVTIFYRAAYYFEPYAFNPNEFTVNVGGSVGRIGNSAVSVADSYNTVYQDVNFVDETNNTFYNPTTNETINLSNWQYDYSTREYSLTTVDDRQISLRYGDDSITIRAGDTVVNNYYYVVLGDDGGGDVEPTPPPEISPAPSPSAPPAGDVGGDSIVIGDGSEGVGGIFKWFGNITVSIGDIFGNVFGGGGGGSGDPDEDDSGGILGWLWDGLGKIADAIFGGIGKVLEAILKPIINLIVDGITFIADSLASIVDAAMQILDIIPNMLGGFADFLGSFFSFLPPEIADIFQILQVGIFAVIIVILIRLFI